MTRSCLKCHYYKIIDLTTGLCRANREDNSVRPSVQAEMSCEKWRDCGQQYHIRLGWLKAQENGRE